MSVKGAVMLPLDLAFEEKLFSENWKMDFWAFLHPLTFLSQCCLFLRCVLSRLITHDSKKYLSTDDASNSLLFWREFLRPRCWRFSWHYTVHRHHWFHILVLSHTIESGWGLGSKVIFFSSLLLLNKIPAGNLLVKLPDPHTCIYARS